MRKLTEEELKRISELRGETRYELIEKTANILNEKVGDKQRFVKCSKCITMDGGKIDLTVRKQKDGTKKIVQINVFGVNKEWDMYNL